MSQNTHKANMMNSMLELFSQSLLASWSRVVLEVQSDELRPWQVFLSLRWVNVRLKIRKIVLVKRLCLWSLCSWLLNSCGRHGQMLIKFRECQLVNSKQSMMVQCLIPINLSKSFGKLYIAALGTSSL